MLTGDVVIKGDVVLRGGAVYDGTGAPPRRIDLGVETGRFVLDSGERAPATVIDVSGLAVCPGFVDIHKHSDLNLLSCPTAPSTIRQGVTTEVVGNCGLGVAPTGESGAFAARLAAKPAEIRAAAGYLDLDPAIAIGWTDISGYLDALRQVGPVPNVATFVPHGPVRAGVVGFDDTVATAAQRHRLIGILGEGLDQGAVGLSTGLVYPPARYADDEELLALATVVAAKDKVFAWHVRDYADDLLPSVRQAISVALRTGCRTQISHLAVVGRRNWGKVQVALDEVDSANDRGCDIGVDCYPYLAGNAPLSQLLPAAIQDGGEDAMRRRLGDPETRRSIESAWSGAAFQWVDIVISTVPPGADLDDQRMVGRTIAEIAERLDASAAGVAMDVLQRCGHGAQMVAFGRDERDLRTVLAHPRSVVASDGMAIDPDGPTGAAGTPHPRSFGCFPQFLSRYCTDLADGIRRCTSAPADRVGLHDRGRIADGLPADLVVFDPSTLADKATYQSPQQFPTGIELVMVGGEVVLRAGRTTAARPGSVLLVGQRGSR